MDSTRPYQVLARRYRPQTFRDVVGQEAVVVTLKNALRLEKIAHAYLFSGSRGIGKTTLARLFAKALSCAKRTEAGEPCNQCPSCKEITEGCSLDVLEIDGASHRGIDDIRQINETVGYAPSHGRYKIYLIDEVHMLTKEAFNALLKTLEEPPAHAKFFFATTEPHKVPSTILSRCQRFDLARLNSSQLIAKLESIARDLKRAVDPEALHLIARFAEGSLRDAESLFDQILCFAQEEVRAEHVRSALGLLPQDLFFAFDRAFSEYALSFAYELVEELHTKGKDFFHFFEQLVEHYRCLVLCKTAESGAAKLLSPELFSAYTAAAKHYTLAQALYALEYLLRVEPDLQKSPYPRISLETHLLHLLRSRHRIPPEVLLRHLIELEKKGGIGAALESSQSKEQEAPFKAPAADPSPAKEELTAPKEPASTLVASPLLQTPALPAEKKPASIAPPAAQESPAPAKEEITPPPKEKATPLVASPLPQTPPPEKKPAPAPLPAAAAPAKEPKEEPKSPSPLPKHPSHYDTLIRFASIELEGTVQ